MIEIKPYRIGNHSLSVPGSKSYSHRALIAASLCSTPCKINGMLKCQDTMMTSLALEKLGVFIFDSRERNILRGLGGQFNAYNRPIYLGDSGTSMRLISALVALGQGTYTLIGSHRMHQRPMYSLIDAMNKLGFRVRSLRKSGFPPLQVTGSKISAKTIEIDCSLSSQYLSSLLLIAPCLKEGLRIGVSGKIVSRPYVDITIDVMRDFGICVERDEYRSFEIRHNQHYEARSYNIEPDCSHACYFWSAAAITGGSVTVMGLERNSKQGDIKFLNVLEKMGCDVHEDKVGITVNGATLRAVDIDMTDMPDMVPTLSVVAAFAKGTTRMTGISHLKTKESDRITAIANELTRIGIFVETDDYQLIVKGGIPHGAAVSTYNDHRIAMSFALAGLKVPGIKIRDELCVLKSFPEFWHRFQAMCKS